MKIGIRREDKSDWERRVPLVPEDVRRLVRDAGVSVQIQRSPTRAFSERQFLDAGAEIVNELDECPIILGVKEIPPARFEPNKTYVFFSHTIKAQPANMPALRRMVELGCTLIDYERIVDAKNRRLVFFGPYAGLAGMIDSLWALGRRLEHEGVASPFTLINPAHRYDDLAHFKREIVKSSELIRARGLPEQICPFVCGFSGYGQVSHGAQQIYDLLPTKEVAPDDLASLPPDPRVCYKVVFREEHMVEPIDASRPFELQEYYEHPERYRSTFFNHVKHLTALINCVFWTPKYPRLMTREQFAGLYSTGQPRLRVVGDISCDIDGSVACTTRCTTPDSPVYVYDPNTGETRDGVEGVGPIVLAVDFLPCELPVDSSRAFSQAFNPFVPPLARADFGGSLADSGLPPELQAAVIVYKGKLTQPYRYLESEIR